MVVGYSGAGRWKWIGKEAIRAQLLAYCKLDTFAMVRIWEELTDRKVSHGSSRRLTVDDELFAVVQDLANDVVLDAKFRDHALTGEWKDNRDYHIKSLGAHW